jgi:FkbM family methyltransferase
MLFTIRNLIRRLGFDIVRYRKSKIGVEPFSDIRFFLKSTQNPVIFDIGANEGQTAKRFISDFPNANVYSFEPSPKTFIDLRRNLKIHKNSHQFNVGIGSKNENRCLLENNHSTMSSFLDPGKACWGNLVQKTDTRIITLDEFSKSHGIDTIHILKSDTQGYDLEVLKGCESLFAHGRIHLIHIEIIFAELYNNLPSPSQILDFLSKRNFSLVSFYNINCHNNLAGWADALFVNNLHLPS